MQITTIQKIGGLALIIGSVLLLVYSIMVPMILPMNEMTANFAVIVMNPHWIWITTIAFIGVIFMIFGFAAVYSRIFAKSGLLGLIGFIMIEVAYILQACSITWEIFIWPLIASHEEAVFLLQGTLIENNALIVTFMWIATVMILAGVTTFCAALIRSKIFPKISGIMLFAGALLYAIGSYVLVIAAMAGVFILSIGCTIIGLKLIRRIDI